MKKNKNKNWEKIYEDSLKWSKWMALYEAINVIADKAQEKNIPFSKVEIKPLAIYKYMEMTENIFLRKILKQEYNIDVCFDDKDLNSLENVPDTDYSEVKEYQYSP